MTARRRGAARETKGKQMDGNHMRETEADKRVRDSAYAVTADELRDLIERFEALEGDKKQAGLDQAEIMAEAKARGYSTRAMRAVIKLRKMKPDDLAEQEALIAIYREAVGV